MTRYTLSLDDVREVIGRTKLEPTSSSPWSSQPGPGSKAPNASEKRANAASDKYNDNRKANTNIMRATHAHTLVGDQCES